MIVNVARSFGNSMQENHKSKLKFGGDKVCQADQVRKYFVNPNLWTSV